MLKSVLIAIVVSLFLVTPAFSSTIGPVGPTLAEGGVFLGLGYNQTNTKWDESGAFAGLKMQQDTYFIQAGYASSGGWLGYLRGGVSAFTAENAFSSSTIGFVGDYAVPFATVGLNGTFFNNGDVVIGPFVQGSYYGESEQTRIFSNVLIDSIFQNAVEKVTLTDLWEVKAGVQIQLQIEGTHLYAAPMFYISRVDILQQVVGSVSPGGTRFKTIEEDGNLGVLVGAEWRLLEGVTLGLEAQFKSDYEIGLILNKRF